MPLKDRTIIEGIAIDRAENGEYLVTIQSYKPSAEPVGGQYELHSAKGKTIYEALQNITTLTGKRPFYSNNRVIILSQEILNDGLYVILDYFLRDNEIRANNFICCSKTRADDLLSIDDEGQLKPAERIAAVLNVGETPYSAADGEMVDVAARLLDKYCDTYLPLIEKNENKNEKTARFSGIVCFKGEKPVCVIDSEKSLGFCFINNYKTDNAITVNYKNEKLLFSLEKVESGIEGSIKNNRPEIIVDIKIDGVLEEVFSTGKVFSNDEIDEISSMLSKEIIRMAKSAVDTAFFENESDVFRFGNHLLQDEPNYCRSMGEWMKNIPECTVIYQAKSKVKSIGQDKT